MWITKCVVDWFDINKHTNVCKDTSAVTIRHLEHNSEQVQALDRGLVAIIYIYSSHAGHVPPIHVVTCNISDSSVSLRYVWKPYFNNELNREPKPRGLDF